MAEIDKNELLSGLYEKAEGLVWAWTPIEPEVRSDALLEIDLIESEVQLIDADEVIIEDLKDSNSRLSFETLNIWDMVTYDETAGIFDIKKAKLREAIKDAVELMADFKND